MNEPIDQALGKRLARARQDAGIRQPQIAVQLGTGLWAISRFEKGLWHLPHGKTLTDYVEALQQVSGKDLEELGLADLVEVAA